MIIPLLAFLGAVLVAMYFAFRWDAEDRKALSFKQKSASPTLWSLFVLPLLPCLSRHSRQVAPQLHPQVEMTTLKESNTHQTVLSAEEEAFHKDQKKRARKAFQEKLKTKSAGSEHSILDEALPAVYRNNSYIAKITAELTRHHRYVGIVYYYSSVYPRALRVLSLGSNILTTLYFISLTYGILNPDKNNCHTYTSKAACIVPKSHFHTGQSQCMWDNNDLQCSFIQPSILIRVILFVVIFAVMLAIPVNTTINYLIQYVLAAPLLITERSSESSGSSNKYSVLEGSGSGSGSNTTDTIPVYSSGANDIENNNSSNEDLQALQLVKHKPYNTTPSPESPPDSPTTHPTTHTTLTHTTHTTHTTTLDTATSTTPLLYKYKTRRDLAQQQLDALLKEVRHHRESHVKGIIERRTFDRAWGLTPAGQFITAPVPKQSAPCTTHFLYRLHHFALHYTPLGYTPCVVDEGSVRAHLYEDILRTQRAEKRSLEAIKSLYVRNQVHESGDFLSSQVGKVIILHLYLDLLPPTPALILQCKSSRDSVLITPVWGLYKLLAWCVVIAVNAYFVFALFMFASTQSSPRLTAWFKSFMLYVALDCAGLATNNVLSSHVLIPALVVTEVCRVKEWLISKVQRCETERAKEALCSVQQRGSGGGGGSSVVIGNDKPITTTNTALTTPQAPQATVDLESNMITTTNTITNNTTTTSTTSTTFNAAKYLYTSHRLCTYFPSLQESSIVYICTLQVPRQAHYIDSTVEQSHVGSVGGVCNLCSACSVVWYACYVCIMPCVHVVMHLPLSIQDAILDYITIVLFGYILLLHMRLYTFYPPLAFVPPFVSLVLLHFYVVSSNGETATKLATLKKQTLAARAEQRKINNRIVVVEGRSGTGSNSSGSSGATPYNTSTAITTSSSGVKSSVAASTASIKQPIAISNTTNTTTTTTNTNNNNTTNTTTANIATTTTHTLHKTSTSSSMHSVGSVGSSIHRTHSPHNITHANNTTHTTSSNSNSPTGTESRLKQFLSSADKVLEQQEQHSPYKSGVGGTSGRSHSPVNATSTSAHDTTSASNGDSNTTNTPSKHPLVDERHHHNSSTTTVGTSFNTLNSSAYNNTNTTITNTTNNIHTSPQQQHSWSNLKTVESFVLPNDTTNTTNTNSNPTSSGIAGMNSSAGTIATVSSNHTGVSTTNTTNTTNYTTNTTNYTTNTTNTTTNNTTTNTNTSSNDSPPKSKRLVKKASRPAMSSGSGGIGTIASV